LYKSLTSPKEARWQVIAIEISDLEFLFWIKELNYKFESSVEIIQEINHLSFVEVFWAVSLDNAMIPLPSVDL